MTSGYSVDPEALAYRAGTWQALSGLMIESRSDLDGAPAGAFPPSVVGAARAFLSTWAASAAESSDMATAYAEGMEATQTGYVTSDATVESAFSGLDSRLGPAT